MKRWILVDYDCTGLMCVQARDEHPDRLCFSDKLALDLCRKEAEAGDPEAQAAITAHDRDNPRDITHETAYGRTSPLSFAIRCF